MTQQVTELDDGLRGDRGILPDQHRNGVQRVEEEMGLEVHLQRLQLRTREFRAQALSLEFVLSAARPVRRSPS